MARTPTTVTNSAEQSTRELASNVTELHERQQLIEQEYLQLEVEQAKVTLRIVQSYDPRDEEGFPIVLKAAMNILRDRSRVAELVGVTKSTFGRWMSGPTIPIKMARLGTILVLESLLKEYVSGDNFDAAELRQRFQHRLDELRIQERPIHYIANHLSDNTRTAG